MAASPQNDIGRVNQLNLAQTPSAAAGWLFDGAPQLFTMAPMYSDLRHSFKNWM
jgi:hypothetical protein